MQDIAHRQNAGEDFLGAYDRHPLSEEIDKDERIKEFKPRQTQKDIAVFVEQRCRPRAYRSVLLELLVQCSPLAASLDVTKEFEMAST